MFICEYYESGNPQSVDCTIGLARIKQARSHGHDVCRARGYAYFWVRRKPNRAGVDPAYIEFHPETALCLICAGK